MRKRQGRGTAKGKMLRRLQGLTGKAWHGILSTKLDIANQKSRKGLPHSGVSFSMVVS